MLSSSCSHLSLSTYLWLYFLFFTFHICILLVDWIAWLVDWLDACLISFNFCFHKITVLQQWINIESTWKWQHYSTFFFAYTFLCVYMCFLYSFYSSSFFYWFSEFLSYTRARRSFSMLLLLLLFSSTHFRLVSFRFVLPVFVDCSFHHNWFYGFLSEFYRVYIYIFNVQI